MTTQKMQHEELSRYNESSESLLADDPIDDEMNTNRLARSLNRVDQTTIRSLQTDDSSNLQTPQDNCRLRVRQDTIDDAENDDATRAALCADNLTLEHAVTDIEQNVLPAASQKRAKDEVDVAASGISLEVRRFQCTKSALVLKEATKNDATPLSSKLVEYIMSLTFGGNSMCTEKEMCQWLVAQMCDRTETGQIWIVAKTYALLSALLWCGSGTFVTAVHEYGKSMLQATHVDSLIRSTFQENVSGERLPCSLQPIAQASAGQKSSCGAAKLHGSCIFDKMMKKSKVCGKGDRAAKGGVDAQDIPGVDMGFLISNVAYLESLCEYRMRHPTLDLAHGEILMVNPADGDASTDSAAAAVAKKTYSPTAWKELLDDTLELMKAIAVMDPHARVHTLGRAAVDTRVRESMLLYQIACRALVRLLHAVLTVSHTFVASIQAGLGVPSSNLSPTGSSPTTASSTGSEHNLLGASFDPKALDFSLTPDIVHGFAHEYYYAIYQFNRTVNMLKEYCAATEHLGSDTAKKAVAAFKLLPEESVHEFKESRKCFEHPVCSKMIVELQRAAREAAEGISHSNNDSGAASLHGAIVPSMLSEEVRSSMLAVYKFHLKNQESKERLWKHQVDAVCNLFDEEEAAMLRQIFTEGLTGLMQQWQEFTNNGAAAAEKALMDTRLSQSRILDGSAQGQSTSDNGVSGDRSSDRQSSTTDSLTRSSTYILRSLPLRARGGGAALVKSDVIPVSALSRESSTESAIDALLQEDDVVVICNEECSCNDTLKLVDRFQVLMDVPLGEGSYGKVYRAWDEVIGCYLAAKELPLDASKAHNLAVREVLQEYTVLTELSHPNIVRVVAFMVLKRTARIYMEWMPSGSLQDVLRHHPRGMLRESVVRRYARDVLSGLAFLHSRGVIHRDVKPGNMLLSSDGAVKLTDFGTSLVLSGNSHTLQSGSVSGTAAYMAPECVQGTYSSASDIWSFGCSVVQLISGSVPWLNPVTKTSPEPIALLFKVGSLDDTVHLERPHDFLKGTATRATEAADDDAAASVTLMPTPDSEVQEPADQTSHAKVAPSAELLDMLDAIFVVDRKKRPSASELLHHPFFKME